jgi:hypothetical protein
MKFLALIAFFVILFFLVYAFIAVVTQESKPNFRRARWGVSPKTLANGDRLIWITCKGEQDFLYATVSADAEQSKFDLKLYEAEAQAEDFNRIRAANLKELK